MGVSPRSDRLTRACSSTGAPERATSNRWITLGLCVAVAFGLELIVMRVLPALEAVVDRSLLGVLDACLVGLVVAPVVVGVVLARHSRGEADVEGAGVDGAIVGGRAVVLAAAVLVVGLTLSGVVAFLAEQEAGRSDRDRFDRLSDRVQSEVIRRMGVYRHGLMGTRGLWPASKSVERSEFTAMIKSRDIASEFPGAVGFAFIKRVERAGVEEFLKATRADGAPEFEIQSHGDLPDLYVIEFLHTTDGSGEAMGFDIGSEPARREAAERAMRTGAAALSAPIRIKGWDDEGPGFVYLLAVYKNGMPTGTEGEREAALDGWVAMGIVASRAFAGATGVSEGELGVAMFSGDSHEAGDLVYASDVDLARVSEAESRGGGRLVDCSHVELGGRRWSLVTEASERFTRASRSAVWAVGLGGVLLAFAASGLVLTMGRTTARASAMAERMTAALRESERTTRLLAENTRDLVGLSSADGSSLYLSPSVYRTLGYSPEEMGGSNWRTRVHADDLPGVDRAYAANRRGEPTTVRYRALKKDGSVVWLECTATPVWTKDGASVEHVVWSSRDVTAQQRSQAEQAAALALSMALARAGEAREAARCVNDSLEKTTGLSRTAVLLYGEDGVCRFVGWKGLSEEYRRRVEGHCPWAQGAWDGAPVVVEDVALDNSMSEYHALFRAEGIATMAFVPVVTERGVVGKLMLYGGRPGEIADERLAATTSAAALLGLAVGRLRAQEALERNERRIRTVIDTALDAVVAMDSRGLITDWNTEAERTFGWTRAEAVGQPLHELIVPTGLREAHAKGLARYLETGEAELLGRRVETPAVRKGGTSMTVELAITAVRAGQEVTFNAFLRDVTEKIAAEKALLEAKRQAEAANRAKSEFLANMSHEIRTPMTAILGFTDLLGEDGDLDRAPERRRETIATIKRSGEHLLAIINDILDISKIEAGKMGIERVATDPAKVVEDVISLMQVRAFGKRIRLERVYENEIPRAFECDPVRLKQVLMNLVGNGIKFTERGAVTLRVRFESHSAGGPVLRFEVSDTGIGMTREQVERLFRAFGQADSTTTRKFGGTGLGLTIAKRLTEMLGGEITVRSEPGKGSVFTATIATGPVATTNLWVPEVTVMAAAPEPVGRVARGSTADSPLAGVRILLAEDGPDNQRLIVLHLKRAGADVTIVDDGLLAVQAMTIRGDTESPVRDPAPFDVVLMDMQMPEMDGYTATRTLRGLACRTPIIALTAHAMSGDREKCIDAGCDDYATKPIDKVALIAVCAKWGKRSEPRSAAA
ncbi:two-component system, NarL family, sensor histidine kinase EvgS [Phycisphaerales bacterium]|nr:two-component system, NarL family, sensor histidine kinase EvgS [Phycisphaerales bacterium]